MQAKNQYQEPPALGEDTPKTAMQVIHEKHLPALEQTGYALGNTDSLLHLSGELKRFINEQGLSSPIQGKQYVNVEGWQYAGAMLRLTCIVDSTTLQDLSTDKEIRYRVTARVFELKSGKQVAEASASCSNLEPGKKAYQHFAIESMCQTRAISKAYRTNLAWLIKAAGFEATPYEEMTAFEDAVVVGSAPAKAKPADKPASEQLMARLNTVARSEFINPDDCDEETIARIQSGDLTDKEARAIIERLEKLIAERNY